MPEQVPFKKGMFTMPLSPLEKVRFKGVKCKSCGALALGERGSCINCGSKDVVEHIFSKRGKVQTHTIIRHSPPPPYPQEKFQPFPTAWVELEDGLIVLSEITGCGLEEVKIDMPVEMVVGKGWEDEEGNDVIMYKFRPINK